MIIPMKKAQVVVLKDDYDKVIKSLQHFGVIMIINHEEGSSNPSLEINEGLQQRVEKVIKYSKKFEEKKPLFGDYKEVEFNKFIDINKESIDQIGEIENLQSKISSLEQTSKDLKAEYDNLLPWKDLDIKMSKATSTKYAKVILGYLPLKAIEKFADFVKENGYLYQTYGVNKLGQSFLLSCYYEDEENVLEELKKNNYTSFSLPQIDSTVNDYLNNLDNKIKLNEETITNTNEELKEYAKNIDEFKLLSDQILTQEAVNNIYFNTTVETSIIEGWVREDEVKVLEKAIKNVTEDYDIEFVEPLETDKIPTYTKNPKFVSQFETITDMFSKPNSNEIDPNPVMSVWYWFLFGMMMGDVGYGALMILICYILKKLMRPKGNTLKLINVIMYSGVPTIFWGVMFGSYFGYNPNTDFGWSWFWYWFNPMNEPIKMLIVSVAIGALHLITGLVVKGLICIKDKDIFSLLSTNLSWILIMCGIGLYFINSTAGIICALIGVALILLFNGANKKSIFGKVSSGLLGLYNVTSYMSDLLSYSRIMALAMSSAAVAMVMNTLGEMVGGSIVGIFFAALIFVVGHLFNLVLGLLSAYVHDSRLQYIEFFGKFFEGGGVDFKPLSIQTKYINEIKK